MTSEKTHQCVRFATFRADFWEGELEQNGVRIRIQAKPLAILAALVERPGELVTREELHRALWPGETFVNFDKNLSVAVNKLREALGDSASEPRYIETVPRRGYRFVAKLEAPAPPLPAAQPRGPAAPAKPPRALRKRWVAMLALVSTLSLAAAGTLLVRQRQSEIAAGPTAPRSASVAVLPFRNLSPDKRQGYLSDGLTEELIGRLARVPGLKVIGSSSTLQFKGRDEDPRAIGKQLGVAYLLEGSLQTDGRRLRVTAALTKTDDGFQVWSQSFDQDLDDVFHAEDVIGTAVLSVLPAKVLGRNASAVPAGR